jgi:hypothetical protein
VNKEHFPIIEITFGPAWWYHHYGMDFASPETWQDPIRFTERKLEQRRLLFERFGDVGLGEAEPKPDPVVGGEFGHRFMSAFWGCEVAYTQAQWPHTLALEKADQLLHELVIPDVETSPAAQLILKNAHLLEDHYGHVRSEINFGGPLNNAVSVLGEEIFALCASDRLMAQQILYQMGEAVLRVHDQLECRINKVTKGQERMKDWGIGNCPVGQISPRMYQEVVLPVDLWFKGTFQGNFSLHHCGVFHPYVDAYQSLNPQDLDVGPGTDLRKTRAAFPHARISAYFEPAEFADLTRDRIDAAVALVLEEAAPVEQLTYIRAIEVGPELSDDSVRNLMTVWQRLSQKI